MLTPVLIFVLAASAPLFIPRRNLLVGMLSLAGLLTILTVWSLITTAGPTGSLSAQFAALAIIGLVAGAAVRLTVFLRGAVKEEKALREKIGRELPQRYREPFRPSAD